MSCNTPDVMAFRERFQTTGERARKLDLALQLIRELHVDSQFPELPNYLFSQAEIARRELEELLLTAACQRQPEPFYEVSVKDAAEALDVSESTIRKWDTEGCPFDQHYPGRFKAVIFYQWSTSYQSLRNFNRNAKKRAVSLNKQV